MSSANPRPRLFRSIGARLALWGTLITLFVCVLVCAVLYAGVYFSLHREVDNFLEGEASEFRAVLADHGDDLTGLQDKLRREIGSRERRDLIFRLLDAQGRLLVSSAYPDTLGDSWPVPPTDARHTTRPHFTTVGRSGAQRIRLCTDWIMPPGAAAQIAQVGYVLDRVDHSLARFAQMCGIALVIAVGLAAAGGLALARRSLRPIQRITDTARRITGRQLSARIPRSGNGDELDRLVETLNDMLTRIEDQVQRIQQFTADASHELRTPLAALRGSAEVALTRPRTQQQLREVLEESIEQIDRLARIAEDLLLLARFDSGQAALRCESVRLDALLEDVVDLYAPLASERSLALEFVQRDPATVFADESRLRQVFSNLIDNAVKYSDGPGRIDVRLERRNGRVQVEVTDGGPGIPAEHLPHVFERFYRADSARSPLRAAGAGLGLAICKSIVEAHGGQISFRSSGARGVTAVVELPVEADAQPAGT